MGNSCQSAESAGMFAFYNGSNIAIVSLLFAKNNRKLATQHFGFTITTDCYTPAVILNIFKYNLLIILNYGIMFVTAIVNIFSSWKNKIGYLYSFPFIMLITCNINCGQWKILSII